MSNKDFPGISNDQLFKNLYCSDIKSTNLQASSLTCDSLSFSGTYQIATLTGSVNRAFTTDEISCMSKKGHLFIHSLGITTADAQLTLGPDTADRANELLGIFGITDTTTKRLIKITPCVTSHATLAVKIKNDAGTFSVYILLCVCLLKTEKDQILHLLIESYLSRPKLISQDLEIL